MPDTLTTNFNITKPAAGKNNWDADYTALCDLVDARLALRFRNLINNGAMKIHQRGGAVAATVNPGAYSLDRWKGWSSAGGYNMEQSTDAPDEFGNSMKCTVTSTHTVDSGSHIFLEQLLNGIDLPRLQFGKSSAKSITLSFWVKSSVAGTYGIGLENAAINRSYVAEYTVNTANAWERKTIAIAGDTSGTWPITEGIGAKLRFSLGSGSQFQATKDAWSAGDFFTTSNDAKWIENTGATFYLTGVQLEEGSYATDFEHRPYALELVECKRYFQKVGGLVGTAISATAAQFGASLSPEMRTTPTISQTGVINITDTYSSDHNQSAVGISFSGSNSGLGLRIQLSNFTGMTQGRVYMFSDGTDFVLLSSDL